MAGRNRIVVDYGDYEGLVLLGAVDTKSGEEVPFEELKKLKGCDVVKKYDGISDYSTLKGMIGNNEEGFVVRFSNGDRIKIKGDEYVRLHRIMTNISTTSVWEVLSSGESMESYLQNVPDEFYDKVHQYERELIDKYNTIESTCRDIFIGLQACGYRDNRKEFARHALNTSYATILFKMFDGMGYSNIIWKMIKPEYKKL